MKLAFDPAEATAVLSQADRKLARVIERAGPFTLQPERLQSPFHALMRAIVYQQLSGAAARTIMTRATALFAGSQPEPQALLDLSDELLRAAGLSRGKVLSVRDLAAKTLDGTVPTLKQLRRMSDAEILERLVQVRGIGPWTVEMLLIFRLGRPDVLPVSDLGVRKGFMLTYKTAELPGAEELLRRGERWRPYRSVASWYLWRAVDLDRASANGKLPAKNG
jgi:3-methyladenine DNA glycosylase/8-oxoguanine DNA glycosylase